MPVYDYYCEENGRRVTVHHPMNVTLKTWGEVCYAAQEPLGEVDPLAPVEKVLSAPGISVPLGNAELKNAGFTKLVRRDNGVFENLTASDGESRYVEAGKPESMPHLRKKIRD
jgi:predicted nucleic acid-binding Zn ribbon protein